MLLHEERLIAKNLSCGSATLLRLREDERQPAVFSDVSLHQAYRLVLGHAGEDLGGDAR